MESLISVFHFTSKILIPKYPHTLLPLIFSLYVVHQQNKMKSRHKLRMFFVPDDLFFKLFPSDLKLQVVGDITSCILISLNTTKALNIPVFSWLILKKFSLVKSDLSTILDIDNSVVRDSYLLQAVAIPDMDDFVLIANDTTYHNIKQTLFTLNERKNEVALYEVFVLTTFYVDKIGFEPYMAKNITLALLQSPLDISDQVIDAVLGIYFDIPRYLHSGDVFSVDVLKHAPEIYYTIGNQNIKILYFKVVEITGESYNSVLLKNVKCGYYAIKDYTAISQRVNVQSYIPCSSGYCLESVESVTGKNYSSYFLSYCPSGLNQYFNELVDSLNPFIQNVNELTLQVCPIFLIHGPRGVGKQKVVKSAAKVLGLQIWNVDCLELQSTTPGQAEGKLNFIFTRVHKFSPCILLLRNIEALCKDKDGHEDSRVISSFHGHISTMFEKKEKFPALIVATCNTKNATSSVIVPALARIFLHIIRMEAPNEKERAAIFEWIIKGSNVTLGDDVSVDKLASRSSGFLFADLQTVVSQALRYCYKRLKAYKENTENASNVVLGISDFEEALDIMNSAYSDAIGAPKIPAVTWNDVGGLTDLKSEIMRTIMLPIRHPEMIASGLRRSGILLFGPPGTGKTLLAKAVATECNLNFLSVKGPELLNMYVGQSEENVREVFARARAASPCIIFFDELDSLAPNRGRSGDSAGVMDRVVSQLLSEMDGLQKSTHLFVIGATNRPDLIDPALLRPGRFDKLLYVGVCADKNAQLAVLTALTRKFHFRDGVSFKDLVANLPSNLTGADLYSVCANAWLNAVRSRIQQGVAEGSSKTVEVGPEHFQAAVENLVASVSEEDLAYFRKLHQQLGVPFPSTL